MVKLMKHVRFSLCFISIAYILFFAFSTSAFSKHGKTDANITGHILNKETKAHIPYVTIRLKGTTIGAVADATGHFFIKHVPVGKYTIVASYLGFATEEQEIEVEANKMIEVNFELEEQALAIDEIVVTSSRNETTRREASSIVNVVTPALFENTASYTVADVLKFQPGLRVEYTCQNCGTSQIRINGLGGEYSQMLMDGRPIVSALASVYGLEQLPSDMVEKIEVVRGGGSALYGSNAIAGVVNIITKDPERNSFAASHTSEFYGKKSLQNTSLNASMVTDDGSAGMYLYGVAQGRDDYDRDDDGYSELPRLKSETMGLRGFYNFNSQSKMVLEYHHINEFRRGGDSLRRPPHEVNIAEQLRHNINGGSAKFDWYSQDYSHRVSVYSSLQDIIRDSYYGAGKDPNAYGITENTTLSMGGLYGYVFEKCLFMPADFTFGFEYNQDAIHDTMLGYNHILDQETSNYGIYFQNEWENKHLTFLLGGRLDKHNKMNDVVFSPRINVRYSPIDEIGLRASYSSGYRAPQAFIEDLHVGAVGGEIAMVRMSPDLKPEYSHSISGSFDFYKSFGKFHSNIIVEGFYTNLTDVFKLVDQGKDDAGNLILERQNVSGASVKGLNVEMKLAYTSAYMLEGGFTYQSSHYNEATAWSDDESLPLNTQMLRTPNSYGYLVFTLAPISPLKISITGNYTGTMLVPHYAGYIEKDSETWTDSFFDLGGKIAYDFSINKQLKLQVNAGVKNILDSFQKDLDQGPNRDAGYIYGPIIPRTFLCGIKVFM